MLSTFLCWLSGKIGDAVAAFYEKLYRWAKGLGVNFFSFIIKRLVALALLNLLTLLIA
jgi:hypothetical protein